MRAELEEPGSHIGAGVQAFAQLMRSIGEGVWFAESGDGPRWAVIVAVDDDAGGLMEMLRERAGEHHGTVRTDLPPEDP